MKFKYSVIGDNSQENREWLEKVGYEQVNKLSFPCRKIITYPQGVYTLTPISITNRKDVIDCTNNPPLFKAVSAMREDSDYGQLFECKDGLFICQYKTSREHIDKECKGWDITNLHECTLTELQERFKLN